MECGEDTGFVRAKRKCAKAKTNIRIQKPQQQQQQQQKNISFFSVFDGSCFVVVGRNKMEIHIAGFNRTRVSAQNRRRRVSEQQPKKIILRSACRRACLCRAVPCCHSKLAKTYNFEEAKKKTRNKWLTIITYRSVRSCAKRQSPSALLIWNWHCNDRNNHQISSLKEKQKLKTPNCILFFFFFFIIIFFFVITFFLELNYYLFNVCLLALTTVLSGWPVFGFTYYSAQIQYESRTYIGDVMATITLRNPFPNTKNTRRTSRTSTCV